MIIHVCDRCGDEVDRKIYGRLTLIVSAKIVRDGIDLCDGCCDALTKFLDVREPKRGEASASVSRQSPPSDDDYDYAGSMEKAPKLTERIRRIFKADATPLIIDDLRKLLNDVDSRKVAKTVHTMRNQGRLVRTGDKFHLPLSVALPEKTERGIDAAFDMVLENATVYSQEAAG